jgi:hypothetical protein
MRKLLFSVLATVLMWSPPSLPQTLSPNAAFRCVYIYVAIEVHARGYGVTRLYDFARARRVWSTHYLNEAKYDDELAKVYKYTESENTALGRRLGKILDDSRRNNSSAGYYYVMQQARNCDQAIGFPSSDIPSF